MKKKKGRGRCLGPYGGHMGGAVSYQRGTPVCRGGAGSATGYEPSTREREERERDERERQERERGRERERERVRERKRERKRGERERGERARETAGYELFALHAHIQSMCPKSTRCRGRAITGSEAGSYERSCITQL